MITATFSHEWTRRVFTSGGSSLGTVLAVPVLDTLVSPNPRTTLAEVLSRQAPTSIAVPITGWDYFELSAGGDYPYVVQTGGNPSWANSDPDPWDAVAYLAVYSGPTLIWVTELTAPVVVPSGDTLRANNPIKLIIEPGR